MICIVFFSSLEIENVLFNDNNKKIIKIKNPYFTISSKNKRINSCMQLNIFQYWHY